MFSDDDLSRPDWEMSPQAQRRFTVGVALVFVIAMLLDLCSLARI